MPSYRCTLTIRLGANLKLVIAEALIRISEIKKTLLAEREKYGN